MMAPNIRTDGGWALEISLDVQWAHAIAPNAKILLVEARSASLTNLLAAVDYARNRSDVVAVSMSWGASEFSTESSYDSYFTSSYGTTFFASSGDSGAGVLWPAASPNVIGVGGTTLTFNLDGSLALENAWSGSGGGLSAYETEPSYQVSYNVPGANDQRAVPDVSYDADPNSGFSVYDNTPYQGQTGWWQVGGTSAGAPQWAAIQSIGLSASNNNFYQDAKSVNYSSYFRDITSGSNGYPATTGYDLVTGLGSSLTTNYVSVAYTLTMATNFGTTSPSGVNWENADAGLTISATPPSVMAGENYVWNGWTGTGTGSYTGTNNPATITMSGPITENASWTHQYKLTMDTNFGTTLPAVGDTWYDAGTVVDITATAPDAGPGERYVWNGWTGIGTISYTGTDNPAIGKVTMNGPITETASWTHQYYLTVVTLPSGVNSPTGEAWYDSGVSAAISTDNVVTIDSGSRYRFNGWTTKNMAEITSPSSTSTTVTIDNAKTVTADYVMQYLVIFRQTGLDNTATGTVVVIENGLPLPRDNLPYSIWVDNAGSVTYGYSSIVSSTVDNKQFRLSSVTGKSSPITVTGPEDVTGNYVTQYTVPWTGTATIHLENLYMVGLVKDLQLYTGLKLVVKFYKYDNTLQAESVIENITPPENIKENENVPHPLGVPVEKVALVLTTEDTENVISIIASFTVNQSDLRNEYIAILRAWSANPPLQPAFMAEIRDQLKMWSGVPP
jgi:hypothetical protein